MAKEEARESEVMRTGFVAMIPQDITGQRNFGAVGSYNDGGGTAVEAKS